MHRSKSTNYRDFRGSLGQPSKAREVKWSAQLTGLPRYNQASIRRQRHLPRHQTARGVEIIIIMLPYFISSVQQKMKEELLYSNFEVQLTIGLNTLNGSLPITMVILPSFPGIISCFLMRALPRTCSSTKRINISQQKILRSLSNLVSNCFPFSSQGNSLEHTLTFAVGSEIFQRMQW